MASSSSTVLRRAAELDGDIASSSCDRGCLRIQSTRRRYVFSPPWALLLSFSARFVLSLLLLPFLPSANALCLPLSLSLSLSSFPRQIVQNTGPRNTLGDLHTIEESDGQFSERSGVVATRDSCHDVLTEEKRERERERER